MTSTGDDTTSRIASLDAVRGFAIVGMLAANIGSAVHFAFPGGATYPALLHAEWIGCTFADLVFPLFLFVMGIAMSISMPNAASRAIPWRRTVRRAALLIALGLMVNTTNTLLRGDSIVSPNGTLQRIGIAYLLAVPLYARLSKGQRVVLCVALLIGYAAALEWLPFPGLGASDLTRRNMNFSAWLDLTVLGETVMQPGPDGIPTGREGLLSLLPSVVFPILGTVAGESMRDPRVALARRITSLSLAGLGSIVVGAGWGLIHPISQPLWSSSYILYSCGCAMLCAAAFAAVVDALRYRGQPIAMLEIFGRNALAAYLVHVLAAVVVTAALRGVYTRLGTVLSPEAASLLVIFAALALVYAPIAYMNRRAIYWRV